MMPLREGLANLQGIFLVLLLPLSSLFLNPQDLPSLQFMTCRGESTLKQALSTTRSFPENIPSALERVCTPEKILAPYAR